MADEHTEQNELIAGAGNRPPPADEAAAELGILAGRSAAADTVLEFSARHITMLVRKSAEPARVRYWRLVNCHPNSKSCTAMHDISEPRRSNIDNWCDRFEAEWKSAAQPQLGEYIRQWKGTGRAELFRYLLELDVDYRQRAGTETSPAAYREEFPEFESIIAEVLERDVGTVSLRHGKTRHPSTPATDAPPQTIGDYEILSALGQGGMGVVYKARQRSLNRLVALKMIRSGEFANHDELERFQAEAEAAASLSHPAIVPVYEVGNKQGRLYFSMELVEGGSLADRIAETPMSPSVAARLMEQVARAIAYAHEKGVIHRDLKPANILLDRHGSPRIMDFGLAKRLDVDRELTATGQVLGTPNYMPPEQASGDLAAISPRSDVYSLGAVLYRLIAGRPPFQAATLADTLYEVQKSDPQPPSKSARGIPRDLDTICLRCLEKSPSQRYATALELADELGRFLRNEPIRARPLSPIGRIARWSQRNPLVASLTMLFVTTLLTGTVVSTYFGYSATKSAGEARISAKNARDKLGEATKARADEAQARARAEASAYASDIALSYSEWVDSRAGIARERLARTTPHLRGWEYGFLQQLYGAYQMPLAGHTEKVAAACFVADAKQVLSGSGKTLRLFDVASGNLLKTYGGFADRIVALAEIPALKAWVVVLWNSKVLIVDPRDGKTTVEHDLGLPWVSDASFSADGRRLIVQGSRVATVLWDLEKGKALPAPEVGGIAVDQVALSPNGEQYAVANQQGRTGIGSVAENKLSWNEDNYFQIADLAFVAPNQLLIGGSRALIISVYENGQVGRIVVNGAEQGAGTLVGCHDRLALVNYQRQLRVAWVDRQFPIADDAGPLRGSQGLIERLAFNASGNRLLSAGENHLGKGELIVWNLDEFRARQSKFRGFIAIDRGHQKLAMLSANAAQPNHVRIVDATNCQLIREIDLTATAIRGTFSADGRWLSVVVVDKKNSYRGGILAVDGGNLELLPLAEREAVMTVEVATGGKVVAAIARDMDGDSKFRLRVWRRADMQLIHEHVYDKPQGPVGDYLNYNCKFSDAGDRLAYNADTEVRLLDLATGNVVKALPHEEGTPLQSIAFSPTGNRLAAGGFGTVLVWDLITAAPPVALRGHYGQVWSVAFTHDASRLLTTAVDKTIKVWKLPNGTELLTLTETAGPAAQLSLAPDDSRLVVFSGTLQQLGASPTYVPLKFPE